MNSGSVKSAGFRLESVGEMAVSGPAHAVASRAIDLIELFT